MSKRYWHIQGFDSSQVIYDRKVPIGYLSESKIRFLLQMLVARAGLDYDEIVGGMVRRNTKLSNQHLEVLKSSSYPRYSCGSNPYFHACIVNEAGLRFELSKSAGNR